MKISEFLHLALPEEQWLPMISGVLRQFGDEECYVYERQPCWYIGRGCQAQLQINADGTQATFIDDCSAAFFFAPKRKMLCIMGNFKYA